MNTPSQSQEKTTEQVTSEIIHIQTHTVFVDQCIHCWAKKVKELESKLAPMYAERNQLRIDLDVAVASLENVEKEREISRQALLAEIDEKFHWKRKAVELEDAIERIKQ